MSSLLSKFIFILVVTSIFGCGTSLNYKVGDNVLVRGALKAEIIYAFDSPIGENVYHVIYNGAVIKSVKGSEIRKIN